MKLYWQNYKIHFDQDTRGQGLRSRESLEDPTQIPMDLKDPQISRDETRDHRLQDM
jgi:hypothetical protein